MKEKSSVRHLNYQLLINELVSGSGGVRLLTLVEGEMKISEQISCRNSIQHNYFLKFVPFFISDINGGHIFHHMYFLNRSWLVSQNIERSYCLSYNIGFERVSHVKATLLMSGFGWNKRHYRLEQIGWIRTKLKN